MELISNYSIEDIARFRTLRKAFTSGSRSIRILSNHSIQFLEWCIAGHLYKLGINDINIQESYFDDFYTFANTENKVDIIVISISYEFLKKSHFTPNNIEDIYNYLNLRILNLKQLVNLSLILIFPELDPKQSLQFSDTYKWNYIYRPKLMESLHNNGIDIINLDDIQFEGDGYLCKGSSFNKEMLAYSPNIIGKIGIRTVGCFRKYLEPHTKLIAVDLDNTLWHGELGETGIDNVIIDDFEEYAFLTFQKYLLNLKNKGILLVAISKNNDELVQKFFQQRSDCLLKPKDFVRVYAGWKPKSYYLKKALEELNLSTSGILFIDDSSIERNEMILSMKAVEVPNLSKHYRWVEELENHGIVRYGNVLKEDLSKTEFYSQDSKRIEMNNENLSQKELNLKLGMSLHPFIIKEEKDIERAIQLINKSNQFNIGASRIDKNKYKSLIDKGNIFIGYALSDNLGDFGTIASICIDPHAKNNITIFAMSCRAMGRNIESAIFEDIIKHLPSKTSEVSIIYSLNDKNRILKELLPRIGFSLKEDIFYSSVNNFRNCSKNLGIKVS